MGEEIWKDVKGFEGLYWVSNLGRVKTRKRQGSKGGLLKKRLLIQTGYPYVDLQDVKNKKVERYTIHRLVAIHFIPNPENKPQVNHINSIRDDNRVENLEWVTNLENVQHSQAAGRFNHRGENNNSAKLTEKQVVEIKVLLAKGDLNNVQIGKIFNATRENIRDIKHGKIWNHVTIPNPNPKK